jgi:hypothetical protein
MLGTWKGYYKYNNQAIQKSAGLDRTYFTIHIHSFDGKKFEGSVTDDADSGGMEGEGKIIGQIEDTTVSCRKYMPKNTYIFKDGTKKVFDGKHPTIYYSGTISDNGNKMEGRWKIKRQFIFLFGFIPFPIKAGGGTWSMQLVVE